MSEHGERTDHFRGGFTDANGHTCLHGARLEYRFGRRHGTMVEAFHDGDLWVEFDDREPGTVEAVKWIHCCWLPPQYEREHSNWSA